MKKRFIKENLEDIIKLILACIFLVVLLVVINKTNETSNENDKSQFDETVEFDKDSYSEIKD